MLTSVFAQATTGEALAVLSSVVLDLSVPFLALVPQVSTGLMVIVRLWTILLPVLLWHYEPSASSDWVLTLFLEYSIEVAPLSGLVPAGFDLCWLLSTLYSLIPLSDPGVMPWCIHVGLAVLLHCNLYELRSKGQMSRWLQLDFLLEQPIFVWILYW